MFMEQLRGLGHAPGEYVGGGKADMEQEETEEHAACDKHRTELDVVCD